MCLRRKYNCNPKELEKIWLRYGNSKIRESWFNAYSVSCLHWWSEAHAYCASKED